MNCPSCAHENRPNAKFCGECGAPLRRACAGCGSELPPGARFCDECGVPVAGTAPAPRPADPAGARKVVTLLFADLAGSTALHERLDPESARRFMESYYALAREAVEHHGGTLAKLLGDGVLAVFGVPRVAEDDAIRAVRAGVAMQDAFRALAERKRGLVGETGLRVAINTGEVVVQGEEILGDPVNVAARLQERARDGDVVMGEATRRLVASQVSLEFLGSFELKGRAEAVKAYRVASLDAPGRAATPFVGREDELARIAAVYDKAAEAPAARLAVLLGSPGLGKSRLIDEFVRRIEQTSVVVAAHCDAAGGATFAPLAEALRKLLDLPAGEGAESTRAAVEATLPDDEAERPRIATGIAAVLSGSPGTPEETFFVVRRFLAGLAKSRPVVLVIDDLQWAEPLLLDLVEHLVQWGRGLPLLVLIGARPELREVRSSFGTPGALVADVVALGALDASVAMRLAAGVIGAADLPAAVAARVLATSEGNPLFIGELVRMLVDEGALVREGERWVAGATLATVEMPPTIHALLSARIERLEPPSCAVLERAAVVGRQFSRSAVAALLPGDAAGLDEQLESLQRAQLIERDSGWFLGEPALRFHHLLIRDAAYRRLLKGSRVELHERLAGWIEERVGDAAEHDETIGRHLEEAHRLLGELGPIESPGRQLGERAAARLAAAGRRALEGDDVPLAAGLLGRALERLDANDPGGDGRSPEERGERADLVLDWCEALLAVGDVARAESAIERLGRLACDSDRLRAWHTCFAGHYTVLTAPRELSATVETVADAATMLASLGDAAGEAKGHFVHALALSRLGRVGACEASLDRALAAARLAGDRRRANTVLAIAPRAALWGPSPVTRASGRCLDVVRVLRITQSAPAVEAVALSCQGALEALRGRTDAARRMIASGRRMVEELGIAQRLCDTDVFAGFVALLEGDAAAAEHSLRGAYDGYRSLGLRIDAAQASALLARALLAQDRSEEAEGLSHESEALAGDDLKAAIAWRGVRAEALARRGEHAAAIEFAKAGVEIAAATDALLDHADARLALAATLGAAGHTAEAEMEHRRAVELWEAKGATRLVERARGQSRLEVRRVGDEERPAVRRRLRANAASRVVQQIEAGFAARDRDAIERLLSDPLYTIEHPTGVTYGREGQLESIDRMLRLPNLGFRMELLATLGEGLCLARRRVTASGTGGGRFDVAEFEQDHLVLTDLGADGVWNSEVFAADRLSDAILRLYERHADLQPEGPARERANETARTIRALQTPFDLAIAEPVLDPDVQSVDHRVLGTWDMKGSHAWRDQVHGLREVSLDATVQDEEVLAAEPEGLLVRRLHSGTERVGGGRYERQFLLLMMFGSGGRLNRWEFFEAGREAEALARFAGLSGPDSPRDGERMATAAFEAAEVNAAHAAPIAGREAESGVAIPSISDPSAAAHRHGTAVRGTNAAVRAIEGWFATYARAFEGGDWDELRRHVDPDFVFEDRRRMSLLRGDRELMVASARERAKVGAMPERTTLGFLGDRVCVQRVLWTGGPPDGRFEIEYLGLCECDDRGLLTAIVLIDLDDWEMGLRDARHRWSRIEPEMARLLEVVSEAHDLFNRHERYPWIAPDFVLEDHRHAGVGRIEGADAYTKSLEALWKLAPDQRLETGRHWPAYAPDVALALTRRHGTLPDGGAFESEFLLLYEIRDRVIARLESFEVDDLERALARFAELRSAAGNPVGKAR